MRLSISSMGILIAAGMGPAANSVAERTSMHCQPKSLQLLSSWTPMIASQLKTVVANFALYTRRGLPELKDSDFGNFSPRCDKFTASRAADRRRRSENVDG